MQFLQIFLRALGSPILRVLLMLGDMVIFAGAALRNSLSPPYYYKIWWKHVIEIGFYSLPVVGLTCLFAGMVLVLQSHTGFARFSVESAVPRVVALTLTRELGPVLTGLMIAGRISSASAAEIGAMKVSEQIDALITLSVHPIRYLVAPRLIAALITLPILVLIGDIIGIFGGYIISVYQLDFDSATYLRHTWDFIEPLDVISGLVKAVCFGFIVTIMGCYQGFKCQEGAYGVGVATTFAVVSASIGILLANVILTAIFF